MGAPVRIDRPHYREVGGEAHAAVVLAWGEVQIDNDSVGFGGWLDSASGLPVVPAIFDDRFFRLPMESGCRTLWHQVNAWACRAHQRDPPASPR